MKHFVLILQICANCNIVLKLIFCRWNIFVNVDKSTYYEISKKKFSKIFLVAYVCLYFLKTDIWKNGTSLKLCNSVVDTIGV